MLIIKIATVAILWYGGALAENGVVQVGQIIAFIKMCIRDRDIKALDVEYEQIRNGYRLSVPNTKAATELIIRNPHLFNDYEITKGKMDDVLLAVTGKTLVGGAEKCVWLSFLSK